MIGFIKYMWNEYKRQQKLKEINEKLNIMVNDCQKMDSMQMKLKYNNPSREFALLKWELYKVKHGIEDERIKSNSVKTRSIITNKE